MTITKFFKKALAATFAVAAMASAPAHALVVNFFNGSDLYATLTTTPATSFDLHFVGTGVAAGSFINDLYMNGPNGLFFNNLGSQATASGTYNLNGYNGGGGGGNIYDWLIDFPQANNSSRLTVGEHALFSIIITDPNSWTLDKLHINAFDAAGNSIKIDGCVAGSPGCGGTTTNVPEPASLALLGIGLLGLSFTARKRRA